MEDGNIIFASDCTLFALQMAARATGVPVNYWHARSSGYSDVQARRGVYCYRRIKLSEEPQLTLMWACSLGGCRWLSPLGLGYKVCFLYLEWRLLIIANFFGMKICPQSSTKRWKKTRLTVPSDCTLFALQIAETTLPFSEKICMLSEK